MLPEDKARLREPRAVVPRLSRFGLVPTSIGREERFHLEFREPFRDLARAPDVARGFAVAHSGSYSTLQG